MRDSFWFGNHLSDFLIPGFEISTSLGMITICIATGVLVFIYECLKTSRTIKTLNTQLSTSLLKPSLSVSNLLEPNENISQKRFFETWNVIDIVTHFIELVIGYLLMLMAMSFNAYIMISICIGVAVAYFLFGYIVFNIAAQLIVRKICLGCQTNISNQSTERCHSPSNRSTIETECNESPATETTPLPKDSISYTSVEIHCDT